jgi:hypothetical protein
MPQNQGYIPESIVAGETIWVAAANSVSDWAGKDIIIDGILPANYTLAYQFAASTPASITATANTAGTGWTLTVTGAQTLVWNPGKVAFIALATESSGVSPKSFAVDQGVVVCEASPLRVSSWVAVLAAVDAAMINFAATPNGSISIDGTSVTYRSIDDLIKLREYVSYRLRQDTAKRQRLIIRSEFTQL